MEEEELSFKLQSTENEIENKLSEYNKYYKELQKNMLEIKKIQDQITNINQNIKENETNNNNEIITLRNKIEIEKIFEKSLISKTKLIENSISSNNNNNNNNNKFLILNKKFLIESFDENYIYSQLTKDILDFQNYTNTQNIQNKNSIISTINYIKDFLKERNYDFNIKIFGSFATGLCLPFSELDLMLIPNNITNENEITILKKLYIDFKNEKKWEINYNENSYIPFIQIKGIENFNNNNNNNSNIKINVNISVNSLKHNGLRCVEFISNCISNYNVLLPLNLVIKQMIYCIGKLNNNGGLNSYSIFLMTKFFLNFYINNNRFNNNNNKNNNNKNNNNNFSLDQNNLGKIFIEFLNYYSNFDNKNNFIMVGISPIYSFDNLQNRSDLVIIDPLNNMNNVSERTYDFKHFQLSFRVCLNIIKDNCECSCHYLNYDDNNNNNNVFNCINNGYNEIGNEHCILKKIFKTLTRNNIIKI